MIQINFTCSIFYISKVSKYCIFIVSTFSRLTLIKSRSSYFYNTITCYWSWIHFISICNFKLVCISLIIKQCVIIWFSIYISKSVYFYLFLCSNCLINKSNSSTIYRFVTYYIDTYIASTIIKTCTMVSS